MSGGDSPLIAVRRRLGEARSLLFDYLRHRSRLSLLATALAIATGVVVFVLASTVFAYHSSNHDEAVYLTQAAMLLEGQLELHAGSLVDAFRPWFFVEDGGRLYSKYTPVPAAMYAVSMALVGEPRLTLAVVAAANTGLVYLLGSQVGDRRVGVVAAALFAVSPMALVTTATFLPYAPTTMLNLCFAVLYLRGVRRGSVAAGAGAGVAIGLAFFARPFTALLFALPFVAHAGYVVSTTLASDGGWPLPRPVRRNGLTAVVGLGFVAVALAYNGRLTGDPLVFPYEAFAPMDGPGFGRRRILDHSIEYTPGLALRANGTALWYLLTRWVAGGPLGAVLAALGVGVFLARLRAGHTSGAVRDDRADPGPSDSSTPHATAGMLLAGLFVTVPLGNLFFWGNYNIHATLSDPTDGLVSQFGPFYHFDLLVPVAVFGALALVAGWRRFAGSSSTVDSTRIVLAGLCLSLLVVGAASGALASGPLERNAAYTEKYAQAYEPFESTDIENGVVFVPTPYGDWQNHPFQVLRNDPGFDGPAVYALDRGPDNFAVLDAYPDRSLYRYTYRGEWTATPADHVRPKLEALAVYQGSSLDASTVVGVPDRVQHARITLSTGDDETQYSVSDPDEQLTVGWTLANASVYLDAVPENSLALAETDEVVVLVTLVQPDGSTLTYRQEALVRTTDGIEVVWPPERSVCPLTTDCGREGTYLPETDVHREGVFFRTTLSARE